MKLIGKGVLNFFGSRFFDRRKDKLIFDDNNQKTQWEKDFKLLAPENWTNGENATWGVYMAHIIWDINMRFNIGAKGHNLFHINLKDHIN